MRAAGDGPSTPEILQIQRILWLSIIKFCVLMQVLQMRRSKRPGKKAKDFHPDYVTGRPVFVQYATDQLKKINEAYDKICKARGMS